MAFMLIHDIDWDHLQQQDLTPFETPFASAMGEHERRECITVGPLFGGLHRGHQPGMRQIRRA